MIRIAFLVNGGPSVPMAYRARGFAQNLGPNYETKIFYRPTSKLGGVKQFLVKLARFRPSVCYVLDMSASGVLAGATYKMAAGCKLIIDTGDAILELAKTMGRGQLGLYATSCLETFGFRFADQIVVRGSFHKDWLARRSIDAEVIQDGFECDLVKPLDVSDLRNRFNLVDKMTIGLVGSMVWSERLQMCYGWDLIEVLRLLKNHPVAGVFIGDGSGLPVLKALAKDHGIEEKAIFLGRVPYEKLPQYLNLIDVCLSTQTNDLVGWVRTTGKLPLFLATGRYVLASNVGEAAYVLDDEMLVDYQGKKDDAYPKKLAERISELLQNPQRLSCRNEMAALAHRKFSYPVLVKRLQGVLNKTLQSRGFNTNYFEPSLFESTRNIVIKKRKAS